MPKAPGFIFYPGDYLQDTQNLCEAAQVAYDRIMCLHMKYICVSKQQLDFFTKRLNSDQKAELAMVLTKVGDGEDAEYQISWVVDSILKYRNFCDSRASNRKGKTKQHINNTSNSLVPLVENEIVIEDENEIVLKDRGVGKDLPLAPQMVQIFKLRFPDYPIDHGADFPACMQIAQKIAGMKGWPLESITNGKQQAVAEEWQTLVIFAKSDTNWYAKKSITFLNEKFQDFIQAFKNPKQNGTNGNKQSTANGQDPNRIRTEGAGDL
jgi:hypothetical protein